MAYPSESGLPIFRAWGGPSCGKQCALVLKGDERPPSAPAEIIFSRYIYTLPKVSISNPVMKPQESVQGILQLQSPASAKS